MRIDIFTIFPDYLNAPLSVSLLAKASEASYVEINVHDVRSYATDKHRSTDDAPYGGGAGMVMTPGPIFAAVEAVQPPRPLLLLSASGRRFDQSFAKELVEAGGFSLICGRYEGVDQRVADHLCDGEVAIADIVLSGGEAAALCIIEATTRLVPGVMGNNTSALEESFEAGLLEYPQYTRPDEFRGLVVPEVLKSGDHSRIASWRRAQALRRTLARRPDLIVGQLTDADNDLLAQWPDER